MIPKPARVAALFVLVAGAPACAGMLANSHWSDTVSSCANDKTACSEKCAEERSHSEAGPACAYLAVRYVEEHKDSLGDETKDSVSRLNAETMAACNHEMPEACDAWRLTGFALTRQANDDSTAASQPPKGSPDPAAPAASPVRASQPHAPTTAGPTTCDPVAFVKKVLDPNFAQRADNYARENGEGPLATTLGDLNGDGEAEVQVDVFDGFRNHDIYVLEPQPAPICFRKLLEGWNLKITVAGSTSHCWKDLNVNELLLGQGPPQNQTSVARYDRQRYILKLKR